jgi:hypothetical protein
VTSTVAKEASGSIRFVLDPEMFFPSTCSVAVQSFETRNFFVLTPKAFTNRFDDLGIKFGSKPNLIDVKDGFYCYSVQSPAPCSSYKRTLTLPEKLPDGNAIDGFFFDSHGNCNPGEIFMVTVKTMSDTATNTFTCDELQMFDGFGVLSDETIKSVVFRATFEDYHIHAVGLVATDCSTSGSKGSKGSKSKKGSRRSRGSIRN